MLSLTDDFSTKSWLYFFKKLRIKYLKKIREWKLMIKKQTTKEIKYLRTYNGLEFCGEEFNKLCKENGITRHRIVRYTPQQNGVVERLN